MRAPFEWLADCDRWFVAQQLGRVCATAAAGLQEHPEAGRLWEALGLARWMQGELVAARPALETASVFVPLAPMPQLALADCYWQEDRRELAALLVRAACGRVDCPPALLAPLAANLGRREENELALEVCIALADRLPDCPNAQFGIAYYRERLGYPMGRIVPHLRRAHELRPCCCLARISLASLYVRLGRWQEAHALVKIIDVRRSRRLGWLLLIEEVSRQVGDEERAVACRHRLAELDG